MAPMTGTGNAIPIPGARYSSLFQVNTRVWLTDLARTSGRPQTLDDIPDEQLDRLASQGFDWVWMLSVWQLGATVRFGDQMSDAQYDRDGREVVSRGLYLDVKPWSYHVFDVTSL
jgi:hypothetical protein